MVFHAERRVEAYDGENEELDKLDALLSAREAPSLLQRALEAEPTSAANIVQVDQHELGSNDDLQAYLRQGDWNRALEVLTQMVQDGKAAAAAADVAHPLDIMRAHPELVVMLRGQSWFDLRRMGDTVRAGAYYQNYICDVYPDSISTGIEFVDKLLAELKMMVQDDQLLRRCRFSEKNQTGRCVHDYMKIYFPTFRRRDVEVGSGVLPIGLFGEKQGNEVRCLACHDLKKKKYTEKKLYSHQLQDRQGRQARCPASTEYMRRKIHERTALPPPSPPDGAQRHREPRQ